jgi:hypothetical protein
VFARHVTDVGCAAVRLHPKQFFEVNGLTLGFELSSALLGRFHQGVLRRRHSPPRRDELAAVGAVTMPLVIIALPPKKVRRKASLSSWMRAM